MYHTHSSTSVNFVSIQHDGFGKLARHSVHRSDSQGSGFHDGVHQGAFPLNPMYLPEPEVITSQQQVRGQAICDGPTGSLYAEPDPHTSQQGHRSSSQNETGANAGFTVFKRVLSALLIIADVLIDWTSLADVIKGTVTDESSLTQNEKFAFSLPNIETAKTVLNSNETNGDNCESSTVTVTVSYGGFVLFGSVFALVKLLNIIGETIREVCGKKRKHTNKDDGDESDNNREGNKKGRKKKGDKEKQNGFQLLHGWTETFFALVFEDLPQNFLVLLYSMTCKHKALNKTKTMVSMAGSFVKNVVRKVTCKQKKKSACVCCHYSIDIGCMCCTCVSCVLCSCCCPLNNFYPDGSIVKGRGNADKEKIENINDTCTCCTCVHLEWGCEVEVPPLCSCGRCIIINQTGLCVDKTVCCDWETYGCCGKDIDKDPLWLEKYITLAYLADIAIFVLYLIGTSLASVFNLE